MQDGRWRRVVLTQRHRGTEESTEKPFRKASLLLGVAETPSARRQRGENLRRDSYSFLNAVAGWMAVALAAGIRHARRATSARISAAAVKLRTSPAVTP